MKKVILILIIVVAVAVLAGGVFAAYSFGLVDFKENSGSGSAKGAVLKNPADGLTDEEAVAKFDENFVGYILISIGAGSLHNPPFSSDTPKIEFRIDDDMYGAEVVDKNIRVRKGAIEGEDLLITTSKLEAVKMVRDRNYISESFANGGSRAELVAGKTELASKGYLSMYDKLS